MYLSLSRLSVLDVRWADLLNTNNNKSFYGQHYNPYYELIVVAEGTVKLQVGNDQLTLNMGDSYLLKPWEQHGGWGSQDTSGQFFWVQFSCEPGLNEFNLNRAPELNIVHAERTELRTVTIRHEDLIILPRHYQNRNRYQLLGTFEELIETMKHPSGYFRFHTTLLLAEILRLMANDFLEQSHLDTGFPLSYLTFRKLVNHLNNAYLSNISKQELEVTLDRKYEYLCHVFKKYTGTSIHHYIQQLRVQRAKYLLHNTETSIKNVAQEVGYEDPFYFSRIFKKIEGVSPQQYRNIGFN
ncbi:HTH-type transcriptional activator Btr [compost metagenome]